MAFPTGKTVSGVKSDKGGQNYTYSTGVQPNTGAVSYGNWNTGGAKVATGSPSRGYNAYGEPGSLAQSLPPQKSIPLALQFYKDAVRLRPAGGLLDDGYETGPIGPALGPQAPAVVPRFKPRIPAQAQSWWNRFVAANPIANGLGGIWGNEVPLSLKEIKGRHDAYVGDTDPLRTPRGVYAGGGGVSQHFRSPAPPRGTARF